MEEKENPEIQEGTKSQEDNSNINTETPDKDNSQKAEDESYKKRYADSSNEARRITQVHKAYRQVLKDNSYLLELDEDLAQDVVIQLHEDGYATTDSYEELKEAVKNGKEVDTSNDSQPQVNEEEIAKKVRAKILEEQQEEKANEILDNALSKLDADKQKEYRKEFKEVLGSRKLTPDFAKKEIEKIILYYNKDKFKKERDDNALSNIASNGLNKGKGVNETSMTVAKLDSLGVPKAQQKTLYPDLFPKK